MDNFPNTLEGVFERALELEEEGYSFYLEAAAKTDNPLGKRMFERLAEDERSHIEIIKEIFNDIKNDNPPQIKRKKAPKDSVQAIFTQLRTQLANLIDEVSSVVIDDIEAIDIAIELEELSYLFYDKAAVFVDDKEVKTFYKELSDEEKNHYEVLKKTKSYLKKPELFFNLKNEY